MTQATVRTSTTPATAASTWQMWVPCIGMALCSWLSFVDRQVLNILSDPQGGAFRKESGEPVIDDRGRRVDRGALD